MVRRARLFRLQDQPENSAVHVIASQAIHVAIPPAVRERGNVLPTGMQLKIEDEGAKPRRCDPRK
jgi:hypothetical protein